MIGRSLVFVAVAILSAAQAPKLKPQAMPLFAPDAWQGFWLEIKNNTAEVVRARQSAHCAIRIDGVVDPYGGSSGGAPAVPPGESWHVAIRLRPPSAPQGRNPFSAQLVKEYYERPTTLSEGRHRAAFACGGDWSDETEFYWAGPAQTPG